MRRELRNISEESLAELETIMDSEMCTVRDIEEMEEHVKELQKEFMPEDTHAGVIQAFLDSYDDDFVCTRILFYEALNRTGEMKIWESKELANIMNNAIEGWEQHGNHRFRGGHGTQRSWKRIGADDDGFVDVPEQMELPFV